MNGNFGGILKVLRREHKWGTSGMESMDVTTAAVASITASSSGTGSDMDLGGSEERR